MSSAFTFFLHQNISVPVYVQDVNERRPFPLCLTYFWRVVFATFYFFILISGLKSRQIIFKFLHNQDTKCNPINRLIYFNLLTGTLFGTLNLIIAIAAFLMTNPLSVTFNENICILNKLAASFSVHGSYIWTCLIAVCRILYIKAQNFIKYRIGESNLLYILLTIGLSIQTILSISVANTDDGGSSWKICTHHSQENIDAIYDYKVNYS